MMQKKSSPYPGKLIASAIIAGMVTIEIKLTALTVCAARPVSLSYLAANITVLLADGALAVRTSVASNVPRMPKRI